MVGRGGGGCVVPLWVVDVGCDINVCSSQISGAQIIDVLVEYIDPISATANLSGMSCTRDITVVRSWSTRRLNYVVAIRCQW